MTVSHNSCTNLHFHQQCTTVPISPYPHQHIIFWVSFYSSILMNVKSYLTVVWVSISLMLSIFLHTLATHMSSLKKCLFKFFVQLLVGFFLLLLSCTSPLCSLDINPLSDIWFANISQSCMLLIHSLDSVPWCTNYLILINSNCLSSAAITK